MNVKGAYLNGTLNEVLYMHQLEGFADGSGKVCHLLRPLYSLKQAGHEWNMEFNMKMKMHRYKHLHADPCVYTHSEDGKIAILTIWVDDILLFTDSAETMEQMKNKIHSKWQTTDMGEPTKIVGIEITQSPGRISILQRQSIQRILERQGLGEVSPIQMPLDPNVKIRCNPHQENIKRLEKSFLLLKTLETVF